MSQPYRRLSFASIVLLYIVSLLPFACNSELPHPTIQYSSSISPSKTPSPISSLLFTPTPSTLSIGTSSIPSSAPTHTPVPSAAYDTGQIQTWTAPQTPSTVSGLEIAITAPAQFIYNKLDSLLPDYIQSIITTTNTGIWTPSYPEGNDQLVPQPHRVTFSKLQNLYDNLYFYDPYHKNFYTKEYIPATTPYFLVLIHGNNQETKQDTLFRWHRLIEYFQNNPSEFKRIGSPTLALYQYDSPISIDENAIDLYYQLKEKTFGQPVLLVGHSRGGIIARATRSIDYNPSRWIGIVQLSSPNHGSPLMIPQLMLPAFSSQRFGEIKKVLYMKSMLQWNILYSSDFTSNISSYLSDLGHRIITEGSRSLFYDGLTVPIPTGSYTVFKNPYIEATLTPDVRLGMSCNTEYPPQYPFMKALYHISPVGPGNCHYNYMDWLHVLEYSTGLIPDTITHAGYLNKELETKDESQRFSELASTSVDKFLDQTTDSEFEHQALKWLSTQFLFVPTANNSNKDSDYSVNDGMVDLASQCDLIPGKTIFSRQNNELVVDQSVVNTRIRNTLSCVIHNNMDHADMVETTDQHYWRSIVDSLSTLYSRYKQRFSSRWLGLAEADYMAINKLFHIKPYDPNITVTIIPYGKGFRLTATTLSSNNHIQRTDYYCQQLKEIWIPSTKQQLTTQ